MESSALEVLSFKIYAIYMCTCEFFFWEESTSLSSILQKDL
jgi:hypothetical protein